MISETTYADVSREMEVRELDKIRVVDKKVPVTVYEVIGEKGKSSESTLEKVNKYRIALDLYKKMAWDEACRAFEELSETYPDDGPFKAYLKRCRQFRESPPPPDWDGVYKLTSK